MDPFNEGTELCKVPSPPRRPESFPPPPVLAPFPAPFIAPKKATRPVAIRIPMLSDEPEVTCGDPPVKYTDRTTLKPPDECDVWQHYKQMFNSKVPRDDEDVIGIVKRTYFAAMCDFEVRWEPRNLAGAWGGAPLKTNGPIDYYDNALDHLGGKRSRYGQTHVRIFPGHFTKGSQRVYWPGIDGIYAPPGVWDLYISLPVTAWLSSHTAEEALASLTSVVQPVLLPPEVRDADTCELLGLDAIIYGDADAADHFVGKKEGQMETLYFKVAVVGDGVIPRANRLELPRGILQLHPGGGSIDLSNSTARNVNPPLVARIPMLSDELEVVCGGGTVTDRFGLRERDKVEVWRHYQQMFNSKVPLAEENPAGEVTRTYFAAMCDFEVRWDPTSTPYTVGSGDPIKDVWDGEEARYGQTHITVFPGTFTKGSARATWSGEAAIPEPGSVRGVYLKYPEDFWPDGGSPDFSEFTVEFLAENLRKPDDDPDDPCGELPVPEEPGFTLMKIAVIGPGVLERTSNLELPKGIKQIQTAAVAIAATGTHPFQIIDASDGDGYKFTMRPGTITAPGGTHGIADWEGGGSVADMPLAVKVPTADTTYVYADVQYDNDEVFNDIVIRMTDAAGDLISDFNHGKKLIARLDKTVVGGNNRLRITQATGANLSCTKCNIYYSWAAV